MPGDTPTIKSPAEVHSDPLANLKAWTRQRKESFVKRMERLKDTKLLTEYLEKADQNDEGISKNKPTLLELSVIYGMIHSDSYEQDLTDIETAELIYVAKYRGKTKEELENIYEMLKKEVLKAK